MTEPKKVGPAPEDFVTPTAFAGVFIPIWRLVEARLAAQKPGMERLQFRNCVLRGPAVLIPDSGTNFVRSNLGDVAGDVRNIFLQAAGPRIIGGISIAGCRFEDCVFAGVGFAGDQAFIDRMVAALTQGGASA